MKRPLSRLLVVSVIAAVVLSLSPSCGFGTVGVALGVGGGGGGGGSQVEIKSTYNLVRDPSINVAPQPGQVVVADLANDAPNFDPGATYRAEWRAADGSLRAVSTVRGMTSRRIAVVVPIGVSPTNVQEDLTVVFSLADGNARLAVPVGPAAAVGDADAVLAGTRAWWGDQLSLLQAAANADSDLARKGRTLLDLARLATWLSVYDAALPGLDDLGKSYLAQMLQANSALRAAGPENVYPSVDLVVAQCLAAAPLAELGLSAMAGSGSAAVARGLPDGVLPVLAASQQIGGLLAVVTAYDRWAKALATPCKPVGGLQVTEPDESALSLRFADPQPLRVKASLQGLVAGDEALDARLTPLAVTLVVANLRRGQLLSFVEDALDSLAPTPPTSPASGVFDVAPNRLELIAQSPGAGLPALVLEVGAASPVASLRASQFVLVSGAVDATFRLAEGLALGSAEALVPVQLDNAPPAGLVPIPAGTFSMGSPAPLKDPPYVNDGTSQPVHAVTISRPFWMGRCEVTQSEYQAVMGNNPSFFQGAPQHPVERVTWTNAVAYCEALTVIEAAAGRLPPGYAYRLPTEAEWEYCCRAGTTNEFCYGSALVCGQARFLNSLHSGLSCFSTGPIVVGSYNANAWGLFDMHGNVWEWCLDGWDGSQNYPAIAVTDPYVAIGPNRVFRGGSWDVNSNFCRSAHRLSRQGDIPNSNTGFRVVCAPVLP